MPSGKVLSLRTAPRGARHLGGATAAGVALCLLACAVIFATINLVHAFPGLDLRKLVSEANDGELRSVIVVYSTLPRIAAALLCGAVLALSGTLFQQILRNPLADPSTLGVSAGAYLAIVGATIFFPGLLLAGKAAVAAAGAGASLLLVLAITWRQALSPVAVSIAGMVVNLVLGSLASIVLTFHRDGFVSLAFWGGGALRQNDWSSVKTVVVCAVPAMLMLIPLSRALNLFNLQDEAAGGLGANVVRLRFLGLALATWLAAAVVATVGMIGFVGLAAPWIARACGASRLASRLWTSALCGAALLLLADQSLVAIGGRVQVVPAGSVTSFLGAPLLLWLVSRPMRFSAPQSHHLPTPAAIRKDQSAFLLCLLLPIAIAVAMLPIASPHGWHMPGLQEIASALPWRWPRIIGAGSAGGALALAGCILQRLTGNAMASPEALGVSSGALLGAVLATLLAAPGASVVSFAGGTIGAAATLAVILLLGRRSGFSGERLLLVGIGLGTVLSAVSSGLALLPDPRLQDLQTWMLGSTSLISPEAAVTALAILVAGLVLGMLASRWLDVLRLGDEASHGLGLTQRDRVLLFAIVSTLSAIPSLVIGPLSFVGLMAPHLARMLGARRASDHLLTTALLGCVIMIFADWLGHNLVFPYELPTGLLASIIGGPFLIWQMGKWQNGR